MAAAARSSSSSVQLLVQQDQRRVHARKDGQRWAARRGQARTCSQTSVARQLTRVCQLGRMPGRRTHDEPSADAAEQSLRERRSRRRAGADLQEQVRAQPADAEAARVPVSAAVRARPVGARAQPAERRRRASTPARSRWRRCTARRCAARRCAREVFAGQEVADGLRRAGAVAGAADRVAARRRARRAPAQAERAARARVRGGADRRPATIDGQPFEWIADADMRLGPVLRGGDQRPLLLGAVRAADAGSTSRRPPTCATWSGCRRTSQFANGGESVALIPTRYPGSEAVGRRR